MCAILALIFAFSLIVPSMGESELPEENPDFFSVTAKQVTGALAKQIVNSLKNERVSKRDEQGQNNENLLKPELHFSTLRAEASGSGIPSPTMFVGGFSFMMMPTPEGEQFFSKIMENMPNLPGKK